MKDFTDAEAAFEEIRRIYAEETDYLKSQWRAYAKHGKLPRRAHAYYPEIRIEVKKPFKIDSRQSYGFVRGPGVYATTITQPDLLEDYYLEQIGLLIKNMKVPVQVGKSNTPISIKYVLSDRQVKDTKVTEDQIDAAEYYFDMPLDEVDERPIRECWKPTAKDPGPLALFTAPTVDYSLNYLPHYTGTDPREFQDFIIFTNYAWYMDVFEKIANKLLEGRGPSELKLEYDEFVTPSYRLKKTKKDVKRIDEPHADTPQMPAYHLKRPKNKGISIVNIGVGPSNAKTITDHIAVLRPDAWIVIGHAGTLDPTLRPGALVLAHGYVRKDGVLDSILPPAETAIPLLSEIEIAFMRAISEVTGKDGYERKEEVRTGLVLTTADRTWEKGGMDTIRRRYHQSRAVAVDMESATIAANGFLHRIPYGALLTISDQPSRLRMKSYGTSREFYKNEKGKHILIGMRAMEELISQDQRRLHSRKLRGSYEPAFR